MVSITHTAQHTNAAHSSSVKMPSIRHSIWKADICESSQVKTQVLDKMNQCIKFLEQRIEEEVKCFLFFLF